MKDEKLVLPAAGPGASYEVGYAKPPAAKRFKPGQSGNPKGRPKGSRNKRPGLHEERMKDIILDDAYRDVTVREGHRSVSIPMAQAVMRSLAINAAQGQLRAQRLFSQLLAEVESSRNMLHAEYLDKAITCKIDGEKELRRRAELGITNQPEPVPHPDHVKIDFRSGEVNIVGPMTREEKEELKYWLAKLPKIREAIDELEGALMDETVPDEITGLEVSIAQGEELYDKINTALNVVDIPGAQSSRRVRMTERNG
ncbi:DUF5681 domain-containing protein [Roseobacter ponti]|uniref:DUF5681 domain-containing protein n=1 Tax=Roseobacter ponti TaxID=1891787 RepID=A0A858SV06_9RHOB|nr:DUF5681 domain-containing protein [Roseobacter ponti]QJF50726.1 hypothetical protein G3256_05920 [Roseobacter ponti]